MAESLPTERVLCRYFMNGACWHSDKCAFSHDHKDKPNMICTHYQQGICAYGSGCRYDHIKPKNTLPERSSTGSVRPPVISSESGYISSSGMVKLTKGGGTQPIVKTPNRPEATEWVKAPEFVPGQKWLAPGTCGTYLEIAQAGLPITTTEQQQLSDQDYDIMSSDPDASIVYTYTGNTSSTELCPYAAHGDCPYGFGCQYVHGDICDMCGLAVLSPFDEELRKKHVEECIKEHEKDMELSFAVQRSKDKVCGICMDVIWDKVPHERRFGILSDCSHIYCLECIRKWRSAKQFENKIIRACPECRVKSDFVTPSKYWVEDKADKMALIDNYKQALSQKACKYFDEGRGECPFNEKCFYRHAYPDGRSASPRPVRRRQRQNADGEVDIVRHLVLWDVIQEVNERRLMLADGLVDDLDELFLHLGVFGMHSSDEEDNTDEDDDDY